MQEKIRVNPRSIPMPHGQEKKSVVICPNLCHPLDLHHKTKSYKFVSLIKNKLTKEGG